MLIRLFLLALLICFSIPANAEYYLVYQQPSTHYISLDFSTKSKKQRYHHSKQRTKHFNENIFAERTYSCGCAPDSCTVPKREIYTGAPTNCVTYETVLSGYQ